uniref:FAM65 N-terminal domain-containing protein n=1 Tax=Monopterus albus TaxID=43700 RepID=A0A3Q3KHD9_MONAL
MSVKLRFDSPADGGLVHRSRSFTGISSLTGRRRPPSARNSLRSKATAGGKSPRMHLSPSRGGGGVWSLQPEQVDRVFQALRKGLKYCLEGHQTEMDFLSTQQRETKRNSRLAFLYDLEKVIFAPVLHSCCVHLSPLQVEELYETYCIQWRLCQGALNMKRAFSLSPSTRASRESLLELNRNHRHSLQDMSVMEGELEILLGELHIKMKGLIGFARLCPGDQYEVVVRLGRQRWRIRGKIESDDTQSWDEEEMFFLPHIHHNFEIKVTEAKGLSWLLVGTVTCASADFFVARPQLMLVDITELGTIKLQLEVTWNPFDSTDKMRPLSVSRQSLSSRKASVYSWTAPSTPSFTEKYFIVSTRTHTQTSVHSTLSVQILSHPGHSKPTYEIHVELIGTTCVMRFHLAQTPPFPRFFQDSPISAQALPSLSPELPAVALSSPTMVAPTPGRMGMSSAQRRAQAFRLGALIAELEKMLQNQKELKALDHQISHISTILKNDLSLLRSSSSEETLAVEEVLGSFDFLSHDLNADDDTSCLGSMRLKDSGISSFQQSTLRSLGLLSQHSQSASEEELVITPLTSGNWGLDQALETHLDICCILLQVQYPSQTQLLEEMSLQAQVLDRVSCLLLEKNDNITARDILPKAQRMRDVLLFWEECVSDSSSPFSCRPDSFCKTLKKRYTHKVKAKQPGQSEKVFSQLLQQVQTASQMVPGPQSVCSPDRVTLFQLSVYLKRWSIQELGAHISRLSKEEYMLSALRSPKRRQALNKLRGRRVAELLPLGCTLQTLAALQIDANHRVCKAAAKCLSRAAGCKREKADVWSQRGFPSAFVPMTTQYRSTLHPVSRGFWYEIRNVQQKNCQESIYPQHQTLTTDAIINNSIG